MIRDILDTLNSDDFLVGDAEIDFAKGIRSIPKTFKEARKIQKRKLYNKWLKTR